MRQSLNGFRDAALDGILSLLWRQWSVLGAAGFQQGPVDRLIDPEALLAFTCTAGRYDARLFDEVLEWLALNGRFVNVQRLRTILKKSDPNALRVWRGVEYSLHTHTAGPKWRALPDSRNTTGKVEPLFLLKDGRPLPTPGRLDSDFLACGLARSPVRFRGHARGFPCEEPGALLLRLRALFGVSARCEILTYLVSKGRAHSHEMARSTNFFQKTVYDVLRDLECSGCVVSLKEGRERYFRLVSRELIQAIIAGGPMPIWTQWPSLYNAVQRFWTGLEKLSRGGHDPRTVASELSLLSVAFIQAVNREETLMAFPSRKSSGKPDEHLRPFLSTLESLCCSRQERRKVNALP